MKYLTCITQNVKEKASLHNRMAELDRFLLKIENDQSIELLEHLQNVRFMKRSLGRDFRIFFIEYQRDDFTVICSFDFYGRGDKEYEILLNRINKGEVDYNYLVKQNEELLENAIKRSQTGEAIRNHQSPTEQERLWLQIDTSLTQQVMVLETEAWINAQNQEHFKRSANEIFRKFEDIYQIIDNEIEGGIKDDCNPRVMTHRDFVINYQYFSQHHILMLLSLTKETENITATQNHIFSQESDKAQLIKYARRAYPLDVFLLGKDDLASIQAQHEGNLALSPEESEILDNAHHDDCPFPLFINGRAGSGKSTILQYLLKDYIYLTVKQYDESAGNTYTPLYLTYSKKLLEAAKLHVDKLASCNANLVINRDDEWVQKFEKYKNDIFSRTFKLFQDFLFELLPEESKDRFMAGKRLGYSKFRRLWEQCYRHKKQTKKYSADLVWHVIRTYIKGMSHSPNTPFTPEDYKKIPDRQKTVSLEVFQEIYETFYKKWYVEELSNYYWDDQDLALTVLTQGDLPRTYPAIFCDEAQDFTAIELKILYHLSIFSERSLPGYEIGKIPFVFAGDPLQTLNPTGFRWESVKSSFHNFLLLPMEHRSEKKSQPNINYSELLHNYRSSKSIVEFCNLIQLVRMCLFPGYDVKAQESWFGHEGTQPLLYADNTLEAEDLLKDTSLVIIPNCHEDEEIEYVQEDEKLKNLVEKDEIGTPTTVLSPNRAKGLEYDEIVVLYNFGKSCPESLLALLNGTGRRIQDVEVAVSIEWEYFMNRLYVAASRARQRLVIIDDAKAIEKFWNRLFCSDAEQLVRQLDSGIRYQEWVDKVQGPRTGTQNDLSQLKSNNMQYDDKGSLAEKYRKEGIENDDSSLLRRARNYFIRTKEQAKADDCVARACFLEAKYEQSAIHYLKAGNSEEALKSWWAGAHFKSIRDHDWSAELSTTLQSNFQGQLQIKIARMIDYNAGNIVWSRDVSGAKKLLVRLEKIFDQIEWDVDGWKKALTHFLERLRVINKEEISACKEFCELIKKIGKALGYPLDKLAEIAYKLENYQIAIDLWQDSGKTTHNNYYNAQYQIKEWPETLQPLKMLKNYQQCLKDWEENNQEPVSSIAKQYRAILIEALIETDSLSQAVSYLCRDRVISESSVLLSLTEKLCSQTSLKRLLNLSQEDAEDIEALHVKALIESRKWDELSRFIQWVDDLWVDDLKGNGKKLFKADQSLAENLAYTTGLHTESGEALEKISTLLRSRFWDKREKWLPVIEKRVGLHLVGAAIERANRINDALDYYYWAVSLPKRAPTHYRYCEGRLAGCLQKRVDWMRSEGKISEDDERKITDIKKKLGFDFVELEPDLGQYPDDGIIPEWYFASYLESKRPISPEENAALQNIKKIDSVRQPEEWVKAVSDLVKTLVDSGKWNTIVHEWCQRDSIREHYPNISESALDRHLDSTIIIIVKSLAVSQYLEDCPNNTRSIFSSLLLRLRGEASDWPGCKRLGIDHDVLGSALERLGQHMNCIQFYEWAIANANSLRDRKFMAERLIVARERYAKYLRDTNKNDPAERQEKMVEDLRREFNLRGKQISKYPEM